MEWSWYNTDFIGRKGQVVVILHFLHDLSVFAGCEQFMLHIVHDFNPIKSLLAFSWIYHVDFARFLATGKKTRKNPARNT